MDDKIEIFQSSENSVVIEFGQSIKEEINKKIRIFCDYIEKNPIEGMIEYIPYFTSVSILYEPMRVYKKNKNIFDSIKKQIEDIICRIDFSSDFEKNIVKIPVCYDEKLGPDIKVVAEANQLSVNEVIDIHTNGEYLVYMIGFAPGFPYLGGMDERISTPRRESPRTAIPQGSVGIAGMQTGVYPIETPGGWQIIGRTPLKLFDLNREKKTLLKSGDTVKFYSISYEEYLRLKED